MKWLQQGHLAHTCITVSYTHFEILCEPCNLIGSQRWNFFTIAPFYVLNHIFSPANETALPQHNNQSNFKACLSNQSNFKACLSNQSNFKAYLSNQSNCRKMRDNFLQTISLNKINEIFVQTKETCLEWLNYAISKWL